MGDSEKFANQSELRCQLFWLIVTAKTDPTSGVIRVDTNSEGQGLVDHPDISLSVLQVVIKDI